MSDHQFVKVSKYRLAANNVLRLAKRNCFPIHLNLEINATKLLEFKKRHGHSLNAILTKIIADIVVENKSFLPLNSVLQRGLFGDRILIFQNVSFSMAQDKTYGDEKVASVYILDEVNKRSMQELTAELKSIAHLPLEQLPIYKALKPLLYMPNFMQRFILFMSSLIPSKRSITFGTIGFTNLGKSSVQTITPMTPKTIMFGVGGLRQKVVLEDDKAVNQPVFTLNMMFNHLVVDGRICNDFLTLIKDRIETL